MDKTLVLLDRVERLQQAVLAAPHGSPPVSSVMLGQVVNGGHMPTGLPGQFLVNPVKVTGNKGEGLTASATAGTSQILVVVVGSTAPQAGDYLVCRSHRGRWFSQHAPGGCTVTGTVTGCNSTVQQNSSVSITVGSTTYGPTTTDASGNWTLTRVATGAATITYTPPAGSNYATGTQSVTLISGTNTENFTLSPATGYQCVPACNVPVPTTIHLTDPVYGTIAVTKNSNTTWFGTNTISYPGTCVLHGLSCPAATVTINYAIQGVAGGFTLNVSWTISGQCPSNSGTSQATVAGSHLTYSCPPTLSMSWTLPDASATYCTAAGFLWCIEYLPCSDQLTFTASP